MQAVIVRGVTPHTVMWFYEILTGRVVLSLFSKLSNVAVFASLSTATKCVRYLTSMFLFLAISLRAAAYLGAPKIVGNAVQ